MLMRVHVSLPGLKPEEIAYLIEKHAEDFDVRIYDLYQMADNTVSVKLKGDRVLSMLEYLARNGYTVQITTL